MIHAAITLTAAVTGIIGNNYLRCNANTALCISRFGTGYG